MTTTLPLVDPILDARALRALQALGPEPAEWVEPVAGVDHDVAIIGGGQNGVALAFALRRLGVRRVTVIDAAPAASVGVWRSPARMNVLRTPKTLVGPELGVSELSFRHWFEARHGLDAYDAIGYIRRLDWAAYLDWFREIAQVPVRDETTLLGVEPQGEHLRLHLRKSGVDTVETVRKLVLNTGVVGFGGPNIPQAIREHLPKARYHHTSEAIDFAALTGRKVAILGSAASAFDAAAEALEHGAAEVRLFSRRPAIANKATPRLRGYPGAVQSFALLPDAVRWKMNLLAKRSGTTPPREALLRLAQQPAFHVHLNAQWQGIREEGGKIRFLDGGHAHAVDHLILGTGYLSDATAQPELRSIAFAIATWGDRYQAPDDLADAELARSPYLGLDYQLREKQPGQAPYLKHIHVYSAAASVSFGRPVGDVPCMGECLPKLARALASDLYFQNAEAHWQRAEQAAPEEFPADLYAHAVR
ncbi:NAD(P)-binding domain-containing protein [Achromobacter insolitus]|uniref:FAD-dependent urate hydroxylase n=1 Tax=Achromobacter insolitus TaxID=217204 RepID=A0A6S7F4M0_9BURK|nr:NAD(P)/FAD-dependent oxidoreductase [Achromobacter insolitus]CAB3929381.1 FAD-dependent urate hydroxylase [Achromobacter insolitus]CAB3944891.1 FAD-dependent urate hydroxylase [Achromobacter insolitus]